MKPTQWTADEARSFLAGMQAVATLHGTRPLGALAAEMLDAVRQHVLHADTDLDALPDASPAELAAQIQEPGRRQEFLQFLILMPYLPMQVDAEQVAVVDEIARELGLDPTTLTDLHRVRDDRLKRLVFDLGRRGLAEYAGAEAPLEQLRVVARSLRQFVGDEKVAERYRGLEALPEGTLGRTLYQFYRERNFPLPGEKKSFSEFVITHDCCHILAGFNTDMNGEINVAGFEAGLFDTDFGFELLLEVILDFHMGKAFSTAGLLAPGTGHFDPADVLIGYERGLACKVNPIQGWDFWQAADQQVVDLRRRYGLPELPGPVLLPAPEITDAPPPHDHD